MLEKEILQDFYQWLLTNEKLPVVNQTLEEIIKNIYSSILQSGDQAIDVGSHGGYHTIEMAKRVGPRGKIFSFEPIPSICKKQKSRLRKLSLTNVIVKNIAISNYGGKSTFRIIKDSPGISSLKPMPHQKDYKAKIIKTDVGMLDMVIADKTTIKFIKVDAEGGDFFVLQGAEQILRESRPVIVFECGAYQNVAAQSYGYGKNDFMAFFKEIAYQLYSIVGLDYNPGLWDSRIPANLVGIPAEKKDELFQVFWLSILKVLFSNI